jgi:hypothetical protein
LTGGINGWVDATNTPWLAGASNIVTLPRGVLSIVVLQHRTKLEALREPAAWRSFTRMLTP